MKFVPGVIIKHPLLIDPALLNSPNPITIYSRQQSLKWLRTVKRHRSTIEKNNGSYRTGSIRERTVGLTDHLCVAPQLIKTIGQRLKLNNPREPKRPYSIHRWRLAEDDNSRLQPSSGFQKFDGHCSENTASEVANTLAVATEPMRFRPSNVLLSSFDRAITRPPTHIIGRGYLANKTVLNHAGDYIDAILNPPLSPKAATECGVAVIRPGRHVIPSSLLPTRLQMNIPHPTWIDMLPFSRMRDNLIRHQYMFNHKSFLMDLIGELVHVLSFPGEETSALKDST